MGTARHVNIVLYTGLFRNCSRKKIPLSCSFTRLSWQRKEVWTHQEIPLNVEIALQCICAIVSFHKVGSIAQFFFSFSFFKHLFKGGEKISHSFQLTSTSKCVWLRFPDHLRSSSLPEHSVSWSVTAPFWDYSWTVVLSTQSDTQLLHLIKVPSWSGPLSGSLVPQWHSPQTDWDIIPRTVSMEIKALISAKMKIPRALVRWGGQQKLNPRRVGEVCVNKRKRKWCPCILKKKEKRIQTIRTNFHHLKSLP